MTEPVPVLVVDDQPANLKLLALLLEGEGFEVATAGDGVEMRAALRARRPEVIVMDVQLPVEDGLSLTRALKRDPATASILVVGVSAYAMPDDVARARAAGCDAYVTKPTGTRNLGTLIRDLLARGAGGGS